MADKRITLAWTGASGAPYGLRLLECLLAQDYQVFFADLLGRPCGTRHRAWFETALGPSGSAENLSRSFTMRQR